MDKDEVISWIAFCSASLLRETGLKSDKNEGLSVIEEVNLLYAKLARVEALADAWARLKPRDYSNQQRCEIELREALGEKEAE